MNNLFLTLRFIFGILSVFFFVGTLRSVYSYMTNNGGQAGVISPWIIAECVLLMIVSIVLTIVFNSLYDRRGYYYDRVVTKEELYTKNKV